MFFRHFFSFGLREKKATSDPEINAELIINNSITMPKARAWNEKG
ncbi:MAG: hypothetical protein ACPGEC_01265 [Flavobacteriales bacterium]